MSVLLHVNSLLKFDLSCNWPIEIGPVHLTVIRLMTAVPLVLLSIKLPPLITIQSSDSVFRLSNIWCSRWIGEFIHRRRVTISFYWSSDSEALGWDKLLTCPSPAQQELERAVRCENTWVPIPHRESRTNEWITEAIYTESTEWVHPNKKRI